MPTTAKKHFDEDIKRAFALLGQARTMETAGDKSQLPQDIRGAALAMSVGAMDAYLCDKYVDCLTKALKMYVEDKWPGVFPKKLLDLPMPIAYTMDAFINNKERPLWGLRMAARAKMEKDNMYSISKLSDSFNVFLPDNRKIWVGIIPELAALGRVRFTKYNTSDLKAKTKKDLPKAQSELVEKVKTRIGATVQFRHDWIHNCSRPKETIKKYTHLKANAAMTDIKNLVDIIENHVEKFRIPK